jgi:hypothetical protein
MPGFFVADVDFATRRSSYRKPEGKPMRFMILVKATADSEAGKFPPQEEMEKLVSDMAKFHEELQKAGALLDGSGLKPSSAGWRVQYSSGKPVVIDGPFAETKELVAGYTLIQVKSREEALEWSRRFPNPSGEGKAAQIEVRELYELDDFGPDAADRLRGIGLK